MAFASTSLKFLSKIFKRNASADDYLDKFNQCLKNKLNG
jgi:hypothetical protein